MNEFAINDYVEKLESTFLNIFYLMSKERVVSPNTRHLEDIKDSLNKLFPDNVCTDILFTLNTDKQFFGIHINPLMSANDAMTILTTDEKVMLHKYQIELDSKLFNLDLSAEEITAVLLYEVSSLLNPEAINEVRSLIDLHLLSEDDVISIRDSANYSQLIIFAIKDSLYKVSSMTFKDAEDLLPAHKVLQASDLVKFLITAQEKIISSNFGSGESLREPKVVILRWMFSIYKDIKHNSRIAIETLRNSACFSASVLNKNEINKTIQAIDRIIDTSILVSESSLIKVMEAKGFTKLVSEASLFSGLKKSGLRSIEDAYYEFAIRVKNCDTEEDAMYILRGISTRLNILSDYLYNTDDISENDRKHWELVVNRYRELRAELVKKKINKNKSYGLFIDYDALDQLDKEE